MQNQNKDNISEKKALSEVGFPQEIALQNNSRIFNHCFVQGLLQILTNHHYMLYSYENNL